MWSLLPVGEKDRMRGRYKTMSYLAIPLTPTLSPEGRGG